MEIAELKDLVHNNIKLITNVDKYKKIISRSNNLKNFDLINKIVCIEEDIPLNNAKIGLLRATINLWQSDNELLNSYINGQLYYEEISNMANRAFDSKSNLQHRYGSFRHRGDTSNIRGS